MGSALIAAARNPDPAEEDELWTQHLAVLRRGLALRQADMRGRIRSEAARLEREVAAIDDRRRLAERRMRWAGSSRAGDDAAAVVGTLDAQIATRLRRISDLSALLRRAPAPRDASAVGDAPGGTPEAESRPAALDPIAMLLGKGKQSEDQARAAREIAWVHAALTKASRARVSRMCQSDPPAGWQEMPLPERAALVHAKRFLPWAERLRRRSPRDLDIVLRVAVLGLSVYAVARHHRLAWRSCVARLAGGLDLYWQGRA